MKMKLENKCYKLYTDNSPSDYFNNIHKLNIIHPLFMCHNSYTGYGCTGRGSLSIFLECGLLKVYRRGSVWWWLSV